MVTVASKAMIHKAVLVLPRRRARERGRNTATSAATERSSIAPFQMMCAGFPHEPWMSTSSVTEVARPEPISCSGWQPRPLRASAAQVADSFGEKCQEIFRHSDETRECGHDEPMMPGGLSVRRYTTFQHPGHWLALHCLADAV
jgi:hypothetical protein